MGISNVSIGTFNSKGSQSICRASKYDETSVIESDFLTKCKMQYINGTGQTIINGSISTLPTHNLASNIINQDTFNLPSEIDAISNIILTAKLTFDLPAGLSTSSIPNFNTSSACYFSDTFLLSLINKIEIKLGGLVIDTLDSDHIFGRNYTEYDSSVTRLNGSTHLTKSNNVFTNVNYPGLVAQDGSGAQPALAIANNLAEWSVSIPFTGRAANMSAAFLQAGSTTNNLTMTVYYNKFDPTATGNTSKPHWPVFAHAQEQVESQLPTNWKFSTSATVTTHMITETEKNFISNNIINRVLKTSESLTYNNPDSLRKLTRPISEYLELPFDISNFNCNCSHILLSLRLPSSHPDGVSTEHPWPKTEGLVYQESQSMPSYTPAMWVETDSAGPLIPTHNLGDFGTTRLCPDVFNTMNRATNTSSNYVAPNNGIHYTGDNSKNVSGDSHLYSPATNIYGLPENWLHSVEISIGGDRSGFIPASSLKTSDLKEFGLSGIKDTGGIYIIKLADKAFSTAGVPFSRCNSIKLLVRINSSIYEQASSHLKHYSSLTCATSPVSGSEQALPLPKLVATACGTVVQTTVGGSISFST